MIFIGKKIKYKDKEYIVIGECGTFYKCVTLTRDGTTYYFIKDLIK